MIVLLTGKLPFRPSMLSLGLGMTLLGLVHVPVNACLSSRNSASEMFVHVFNALGVTHN